uniref:Auxin-inducible protein n=1 Tax=Zea mays TaxID=4577 RepID=B6TLK3_MAIZE|nr:auxin-inducible protein [Zea mays]
MAAERKAASRPAACGRMRGAEGAKPRGRQAKAARAPPGQGYFTAGLAALFLCLTTLLVFLPLVLPPLPPPPLLLLLVPVGLMAVLLCAGARAVRRPGRRRRRRFFIVRVLKTDDASHVC